MSKQEQEQVGTGGHTGSAVTALASMAAAAAATYVVRKAFSRNADSQPYGGGDDGAPVSRPDEPEDLMQDEDDEETGDARDPDAEDPEAASENSAEDDDEEYDGGEEREPREADGSRRSAAAGSKLQSVRSGALASASQALVPVAEQAAEAAGRYVAQNAPEVIRAKLVPRFIDAFGEAS